MNEIIAVKNKAEVWRERIAVHAISGQSVREYCEGNNLEASNFFYWKRRLADMAKERSRFIAVTSRPRAISASPHIHLPNGVKIELGDGLESGVVSQFIRSLCGVNDSPKNACPPAVGRGHSAKPR